ncbi:MAG: alpha/beta fold hydrolase [Jiangellaceae bacterium]
MTETTKIIRLDGRKVAIHQLSQGGTGRTVPFVHPAPGSGSFDPDPEQTRLHGVALLALDRPGYGEFDPVPAGEWASVATAADDAAAALDELGTGPVTVAGWSAGGRVALALAARRPDLVDRVVVFHTRTRRARAVDPAASAGRDRGHAWDAAGAGARRTA